MIIFAIVSFIWAIVYLGLDNTVSYRTPTYRAAILLWPIYLIIFILIFLISFIVKRIAKLIRKTSK